MIYCVSSSNHRVLHDTNMRYMQYNHQPIQLVLRHPPFSLIEKNKIVLYNNNTEHQL